MYLLGHLGITSIIGYTLDKKLSSLELRENISSLAWFLLLLGSMLPDIIDKSLGNLFLSSGRAFGHTLFFILIEVIVLYMILMFFKLDNISLLLSYFFIGNFIHLVLDQPSLGIEPFFFPLVNLQFPHSDFNAFLFGIYSPFVWVTEILGVICLVIVAYKHQKSRNYWLGFSLFVVAYLITYIVLLYLFVIK